MKFAAHVIIGESSISLCAQHISAITQGCDRDHTQKCAGAL